MKTNKLMISLVAILVAIFAISYAMAGTLPVTVNQVTVNDVELSGSSTVLAGMPSETIPVVVEFTANADVQDLKLKVWIDGYKNEISTSTPRFNVVAGSTYVKRMSITLPNVNDMDSITEGLTLYVRASDKNDEVEESYPIEMQRESYEHSVLFVDAPSRAAAGEVIALDVVLKNTGTYELQDSFVTVTIPELGVQRSAYFGDLSPQDNCTDDCNNKDAVERRIYVVIPSDAKSGDYTIEVKASNYDSSETVKDVISITGLATDSKDDKGNVIDTGKKDGSIPTSIIILTVVLVIVFVVLLIVLIVLLTKKPSEKTEDFGETSYY